jgi:hypothetical protein
LFLQELTKLAYCGSPMRIAQPIETADFLHVCNTKIIDGSLAAALKPRD